MKNNGKVGAALVVGGGIGGIQTALDLADSGFKVYLVEKKASIGGVMAQLDKTFPTNDCAMCILAPKLVSVARHPNIDIITQAQISEVSGSAGNFLVSLRKKARYVDVEKCTGCGLCMQNCPVQQIIQDDGKEKSIELSSQDLVRIEEIVKEYRGKQGNLMPILQGISAQYNYLPAELLRYIARELNVPLSQIFSIATFYNAFSLVPRGRHTISICRGTACHVRGSGNILTRIEQELGISDGGTTEDLAFTVESVRCIGCCSIAPAVRIDQDIYGDIQPNTVMDILAKYK